MHYNPSVDKFWTKNKLDLFIDKFGDGKGAKHGPSNMLHDGPLVQYSGGDYRLKYRAATHNRYELYWIPC